MNFHKNVKITAEICKMTQELHVYKACITKKFKQTAGKISGASVSKKKEKKHNLDRVFTEETVFSDTVVVVHNGSISLSSRVSACA